jgi:hypothetical protein
VNDDAPEVDEPADADVGEGVDWLDLPDSIEWWEDELPDDAPITEGPERSNPYAHDPRLASRLPSGATVGQGSRVHVARHRAEPDVLPDSGAAATWAATPGDTTVRPADSSEALEWREPVRRRPELTTGGRVPNLGVVLELVRVDLPDWRLAVVERLATYLRVTPVASPAGETFVTDGCGCYDPFADFLHPDNQAPLEIRWSLLGLAASDPSFDGLPPSCLPSSSAIQLHPHWSDLRFGWGQRYTTGLQLEVPSGVTSVRLFATIFSTAAFRVVVGGRLGVWWIGGGPRAAALRAAVSRTGS